MKSSMPKQPSQQRRSQTFGSLWMLLAFLSIQLGMVIVLPQVAQAQRFVPRVKGIPGRSSSGATRGVGVCAQVENPIVPITSGEAIGLTTQDYPTFTWYMPKMPATKIWFVLQEGDRDIYKTELPVNGEEQLATIKLPGRSNLQPLQVGKTYKWKLSIQCPEIEPESDDMTATGESVSGEFVAMQGQIRRVELSSKVSQSLKTATLSQRAEIFAQEGIWYDAVGAGLAARRQASRDRQLQANWQTLIQSVPWNLKPKQLEKLIQAPMTNAQS